MTLITWMQLTDQKLAPGDVISDTDPTEYMPGSLLNFVHFYNFGEQANKLRANELAKIRINNVRHRQQRARVEIMGLDWTDFQHSHELHGNVFVELVEQVPHYWRPIKLTKTQSHHYKVEGERKIDLQL